MTLDRTILDNVKKPCFRFTLGEPTTARPDQTYIGGTPFAPAGTAWPRSPSGPLTFLGQFGLAADTWTPGDSRWVSVFLNEAEGYVEPGDDQYCTIWLHQGERQPVVAPEETRVLEAHTLVLTEAVSFPSQLDPRLEGWGEDGPAYESAIEEQGGTNRGECQIGGYPLIYGGGDLQVSFPGGQQRYELIVGLTRYPLKNGGVDVNIVDVLNIYFDTEEKCLVADMDR